MNTQTKHLKGFTIIEVVLVLAIAALIFLMVFIALPALQANQRDTARKNDASTVAAAVQSFASNERRAITHTVADRNKLRSYVEDLDQYEPSGIRIVGGAQNGEAPGVNATNISVYPGKKCNGTLLAAGVTRSAAVVIQLEGSNGTHYCVDV